MLAVARARLARHAPEDIAEKAGVRCADGAFQVPTLGQTVTVRLPDCTIEPPLSNWHALTLLHLLDLADGTPPTGRTITLSQYKDGLVRGSGLDRNAELIIRRDLGALAPRLPSSTAVRLLDSPTAEYKSPDGEPAFYVCRGRTCLPPMGLSRLLETLASGKYPS